MPSPHTWDRKEPFVKDRKQERGAGCDAVGGGGGGGVGGGSCSTSRWREPYHGQREFPRASPRRPSSGHYRHDGGYQQLYSEESSGHGCTPSRSGDRFWQEEDIFRLSSGRCGGKESRGSSRRSPSLDSGGDSARPHLAPPLAAQRSVAVPITNASSSSLSPIPWKNVLDKSDGVETGQKYDRDHSLGPIAWKPLKWSRPSSVQTPKTGRCEAEDANLEISAPHVKDSPARSPFTSLLQSDDRAPNKKPRLGWGQGLAKYEKQKIEGSVDVSAHNGSAQSTSSAKIVVGDSSPKFSVLPGSMSPATPTSVACSSSPAATDEKLPIKGLNSETDRAQCSDSSGLGIHNSPKDISIKFDQLDANSISSLALLLSDLLQPEDACSGDSSFTRNSTINKLLLLKKNISKELEKTECEIDLFENRLKSIDGDGQINSFQECSESLAELSSSDNCIAASSVSLEGQMAVPRNFSEEQATTVKGTFHPSSDGIICVSSQFPSLETENPNSSLDYRTEKEDNSLLDFIMTSNRDAAKKALEEFDGAIPPWLAQYNFSELDFSQCKKNYISIRERLVIKKRVLKFKEHILALKYKALHHLWREDLKVLTMRKHQPKSSKRYEVNSRSSHNAIQKHRSSIRSRFALPENLTLVPSTDVINFTSKLLLDSQVRLYRDNLKMPAQIIDENDRRYSKFNSNNGLIEDPVALEKERVTVNPWMQEEKEIFLEKLARCGKDFEKISSFLTHKTTADCIEFYYKNHKSESFTEVKKHLKWRKQLQNRQSNTYLITSGARFNRETNTTSLELLGAASLMASEGNCNRRSSSLKQSGKSGCYDARVSRRSNGSLEKTNSEISGSEREAAAADVLAGICGALSSDAMSSCITSSVDLPEKFRFASIDCSLTPEGAHTIDEEDMCSDDSSDELESADWTDKEKLMLIQALNIYGKDFVKVAQFVGTRSRDQCKIFYSKARKCLCLDVIQPGSANEVTPLSDVNGGRSDSDDACAAEIDSAICSTQSCSKIDADFTQSILETCSEGHTQQADADGPCEQCEIVGSIPGEAEANLNNKASVLNENKLLIVGGNLEFVKDHGEICSFSSRSNEPESSNKSTNEMLLTEKSKSQTVASASASDELSKEQNLNQLVEVFDSVGEKTASVKIEEIVNVGESLMFCPISYSKGSSCDDGENKNVEYPPSLLSSNFPLHAPLEVPSSLQNRPQIKIVQPDSAVSISFNGKDSSISLFNLQDGEKSLQESVCRDLSPIPLHHPFSNQIDPLLAARGCSMQSLIENHKELKINRKMIVESSVMANTFSQSNSSSVPGSHNDKCVGEGFLNSRSEISMVPRPDHKSEQNLTAGSGDQSHRGGDLKLFGQILTHQFSQKSHESGKVSLSPRQNSNATNNSSSTRWKDAAIFAPRPGRNGLVHHLGELPQRSYGFWDGNQIQTGLPSLPEPTIMLANYPPFSISKEIIATGNKDDYKQAQNCSLSTEKFLETYPESQKRNGFDSLSGFPHEGRMMHHLGGVVVGGSGVSDPVAAIQMHYSGRRTKIFSGDLESLTGDTRGR
ncbi:uncharacterized protein LOC110028446 isoform X2 [Phalaenopsis equestris]|uniref:uncharacterized protein LOC110028446 isoform X2 n=1 Tax=Phalaenopsis equestris TaxID=78828 RepID=UPI0009E53358|nr:uncharacterized protein LOC110028446 isoform X2 [Phalaenopsis equestris]